LTHFWPFLTSIKKHVISDQNSSIMSYKTPLLKPRLTTGQYPRKPQNPENPKSDPELRSEKTSIAKNTKNVQIYKIGHFLTIRNIPNSSKRLNVYM
jgi:hypothetical protein